MNEITVQEPAVLTVSDMREQVNAIQRVLKDLFKEGAHYGTIPGCKEPSLYKAGAEKILTLFRIAVDPAVEDMSTPDCIRYRVRASGITPTGRCIGVGIGEASSDEEKYRWRAAVSDAEFDATDDTRRRVKYYKNGGHAKQVRTNPADVANTILKMAKKRAMVDLTLTATAASDVFTQDLEDMPAEVAEGMVSKQSESKSEKKAEPKPAGDQEGTVEGIVEDIQAGGKTPSGQQMAYVVLDGQKYGTTRDDIKSKALASKELRGTVRLTWKLYRGFRYAQDIADVGAAC